MEEEKDKAGLGLESHHHAEVFQLRSPTGVSTGGPPRRYPPRAPGHRKSTRASLATCARMLVLVADWRLPSSFTHLTSCPPRVKGKVARILKIVSGARPRVLLWGQMAFLGP